MNAWGWGAIGAVFLFGCIEVWLVMGAIEALRTHLECHINAAMEVESNKLWNLREEVDALYRHLGLKFRRRTEEASVVLAKKEPHYGPNPNS